MFRVSLAIYIVIVLSGCGGGTGGNSMSDPVPDMVPEKAPMPPPSSLSEVPRHGKTIVRYGEIRDGVNSEALQDFLQAAAGEVVLRHAGSPLLSLADGTTEQQRQYAEEALALVNTALPYDYKIRLSGGRIPARQRANVPNGHIYLEFAPRNEWRAGGLPTAIGRTEYPLYRINPERPEEARFSSHIWIDSDWMERTQKAKIPVLLSHELLHALGFSSHIDPGQFDSIMQPQIDHPSTRPNQPKGILFPLDRDGLLALYGLDIGDSPNDLGPWDDTSTHIRGDINLSADEWVSFGAGVRNGFVMPWVEGSRPDMALETNTALSGDVSWSGQAVGFTANAEALMGNVGLTVNLSTLTGNLGFDDLEYWVPGTAPGEVGSGTTWNDGDLAYTISVTGNAFQRTGGDKGIVTGAFYGNNHEAMGGMLERPDMAVGFGGTR